MQDDVEQLISRARAFPHNSEERSALLSEAIRLSETRGDAETAYRLRVESIAVLGGVGRPDEALVQFAAAVTHADAARKPTDLLLMWGFKWSLTTAVRFSRIPRQRVLGLLQDFGRRVQAGGVGAQEFEVVSHDVHYTLGDSEVAAQAFEKAQRLPRDDLSDCRACFRNSQVSYFSDLGETERALETARPLLEGRESCTNVPTSTYGTALLPLLALGRVADAERCHGIGYPLAKPYGRPWLLGQHIEYLALAGQCERGLELFQRHIRKAHAYPSDWSRRSFLDASALLFEQLARAQGDTPLRVSLPRDFPMRNPRATYRPSELAAFLREQAAAISEAFTRRNGNGNVARRQEQRREIQARVCPELLRA